MTSLTYDRLHGGPAHRGPEYRVIMGAREIGTVERIRSDSWQARAYYSGAPIGVPRRTRRAAADLLVAKATE